MLLIPKRYGAIRTEARFFAKSRLAPAVAVVLLSSSSPALLAQTAIPAKAGLVDYTQGSVRIDDRPVEATGTHFLDVKENDVVRTDGGRAEVLLGACSAMWIGDNSSFRMLSNSLIDTRL